MVIPCFILALEGGISARTAKLLYVLILGFSTLFALMLRYNGDALSLNLGAWEVHCSNETNKIDLKTITGKSGYYVYCKGDAAVYRVSFVLACFFGTMTVASSISKGLHRGYWLLKVSFLVVMVLASLFIPNSFFDNTGYAWIARIVSVLFLVLQILVLIDFAYQWNDDWVERAFEGSEEDKKWLYGLLGCSFILYLVSFIGIPFLFTFYGDCTAGVVFSSLTLAGIIVFTALTLFRSRLVGEEGAILPASVVSAYCTFICWSALDSNPYNECKPSTQVLESHHTAKLVIGMVVAALSLMWTTYSASTGIEDLITGEKTEHENLEAETGRPLVEGVYDEGFAADEDWSEDRLWVFHLILMTASMYMAMLLTNWGSSEHAKGNEDGRVGFASMWVKILSQWFTMFLYIWSLVAPKILGEYRDFA